jgi:hypothetical protein
MCRSMSVLAIRHPFPATRGACGIFNTISGKTFAVTVQKLDVSATLSVNDGGLAWVGENAVGRDRP